MRVINFPLWPISLHGSKLTAVRAGFFVWKLLLTISQQPITNEFSFVHELVFRSVK